MFLSSRVLRFFSSLFSVTTLTCNDDKSVTVAVSNAEGYYVSILGCTEEQTVASGTATLSTCSLEWVSGSGLIRVSYSLLLCTIYVRGLSVKFAYNSNSWNSCIATRNLRVYRVHIYIQKLSPASCFIPLTKL